MTGVGGGVNGGGGDLQPTCRHAAHALSPHVYLLHQLGHESSSSVSASAAASQPTAAGSQPRQRLLVQVHSPHHESQSGVSSASSAARVVRGATMTRRRSVQARSRVVHEDGRGRRPAALGLGASRGEERVAGLPARRTRI